MKEIIKNKVMDEVKKAFKPEFLNRIDDIVVFHKLTEEDVKQIADIMINNLVLRVKANGIELKIDNTYSDCITFGKGKENTSNNEIKILTDKYGNKTYRR